MKNLQGIIFKAIIGTAPNSGLSHSIEEKSKENFVIKYFLNNEPLLDVDVTFGSTYFYVSFHDLENNTVTTGKDIHYFELVDENHLMSSVTEIRNVPLKKLYEKGIIPQHEIINVYKVNSMISESIKNTLGENPELDKILSFYLDNYKRVPYRKNLLKIATEETGIPERVARCFEAAGFVPVFIDNSLAGMKDIQVLCLKNKTFQPIVSINCKKDVYGNQYIEASKLNVYEYNSDFKKKKAGTIGFIDKNFPKDHSDNDKNLEGVLSEISDYLISFKSDLFSAEYGQEFTKENVLVFLEKLADFNYSECDNKDVIKLVNSARNYLDELDCKYLSDNNFKM